MIVQPLQRKNKIIVIPRNFWMQMAIAVNNASKKFLQLFFTADEILLEHFEEIVLIFVANGIYI